MSSRGRSGGAAATALRPPRVGVVHASRRTGSRVAAALATAARRPGAIRPPVVGLDPEPGLVEGLDWRPVDPATPALAAAIGDLDVLVWVAATDDLTADLALGATERRARMTRTAQAVVTAAAAAGVGRVVVVTSAKVYGALPDNPVPLPADAPLRATRGAGVVGDLMAVEDVLASARSTHPALTITVLRPAALVGPGVDTVVTRHFEAPRLLTVRGAEPTWQFCHVDDLASAVVTVVRHPEVGPAVPVGSAGWLTQEQVELLSGMRRVQLTEAMALGTAQRLHQLGVLPAPASELALVIHPWAVDTGALRRAGWAAAYDNETCLGVLLETIGGRHAVAARRIDRKDAALGAASAAVAMVGTAAVLRRARRR